jgi:hypothetical protein
VADLLPLFGHCDPFEPPRQQRDSPKTIIGSSADIMQTAFRPVSGLTKACTLSRGTRSSWHALETARSTPGKVWALTRSLTLD